jgi:integrase
MGEVPIDQFQPKHVKVIRDRKAAKPGAARNRLKALRCLFTWAVEAEHAKRNVAREVRPIRYASAGFYTWTVDDVRRFEAHHPIGSKARLAMALLLFTGQRRSDVVLFGPRHAADGVLRFVPRKTRKKVPKSMELPLLPQLEAVIAATVTGESTFLVTDQAKPKGFTSNGFGNRFREWCDQAGLPHCSAHGLRKAGACIAAEGGATEPSSWLFSAGRRPSKPRYTSRWPARSGSQPHRCTSSFQKKRPASRRPGKRRIRIKVSHLGPGPCPTGKQR